MKMLFVIFLGLFSSWHLTDLSSESSFQSIFAPILLFVFLISLAIWIVIKTRLGKMSDGGTFYGGSIVDETSNSSHSQFDSNE